MNTTATRARTHRPGATMKAKGRERLAEILSAARAVFMEAGYSGFTMRRVAERAGITIGNLNYYYRTKEDLLRDLVDHVVGGYLDTFDQLRDAAGQAPDRQLESILDFWIEDLGTADTTRFFPELWALANHDPHVADIVDRLYARVRGPIHDLVRAINPMLTLTEIEQLALFMCATMEGLTVFAGHGKPWADRRVQLKRMAIASFMQLVRSRPGSPAERGA